MTGTNHKDPDALGTRRRINFFLFSGFLVLLLLAGNLLYGTALFTRNNRSYCLNCHQYNEPSTQWEPSKMHSSGFACVPCHAVLPGRQGRCGAFSAHPETVNPNCIGCHPLVREGRPVHKAVEVRFVFPQGPEGRKVFYEWDLQDLMYKWHIRNEVCLCTDCHRNIAHDKGADVSQRNRPKMAYCKECHYHAVKDNYVKVTPLPELVVKDKFSSEK